MGFKDKLFGRGQPREPSFGEQVKMMGNRDIRTYEALGQDPSEIFTPTRFDQNVMDDLKINDLFNPNLPSFVPLLLPLYPLISRLNYLSNCSLEEAEQFRLDVIVQITRLKNRARSLQEFILLDSLRTFFFMRVNDSVMGFKIRALAESHKFVTMREQQEQKPHWWNRQK